MQTEFIGKKHLDNDVWQFEFTKPANFNFIAGDFCELELGDTKVGGARWLTIACSPLDKNLCFITKIPDEPSDFKKSLSNLKPAQKAWLSPALGMFHLPRNTDEKVLFLALGLGITPYYSMLKLANQQSKTINTNLLYWAKSEQHLNFAELATAKLITTDEHPISLASIGKLAPDWQERTIYLSGPEPVCLELYKDLRKSGIPQKRIKLDYFEGYDEI